MRRTKKSNKGLIVLILFLILILGLLIIKFYAKDRDIINDGKNHSQGTKNEININKDNEEKENSAISTLGIENYENDSLGIVINKTDDYDIKDDNLKVNYFEKDSIGEELAVVPRYMGSKVIFYSVTYEGDMFKEDEKLYEIESIKDDNSIIMVKAQIPCGVPNLKVVIEKGQEKAEYIFTYDGKGDRATIENILKTKN